MHADTSGERSRAWLAESTAALLLLLAAFTLIDAKYYHHQRNGIDFYQFWVVTQAVRQLPVDNVYAAEDRRLMGSAFLERAKENALAERQQRAARYREELDNYSSPFLYTVFAPFGTGNYERDYLIFFLVSLVAGVAAVLSLARGLHYPLVARLVLVCVLTMSFGLFRADVRVGNVNLLQLGALALVLYLLRPSGSAARHLFVGAVLGLAVLFKPNLALVPILLAVSWTFQGRLGHLARASAGFLGGAAVAVASSSLYFGTPRCWVQWTEALGRLSDGELSVVAGNLSLVQILGELADWNISSGVLVLPLVGVVAALWLTRGNVPADAPESLHEHDQLVVGLGCLIMLTAAPLSWLHYFVLAVPPLLFVLRPQDLPAADRRSAWIVRRVLGLLALVLLAGDPVIRLFSLHDAHLQGLQPSVGALILFGLVLWELVLLGPRDRAPSGSR